MGATVDDLFGDAGDISSDSDAGDKPAGEEGEEGREQVCQFHK